MNRYYLTLVALLLGSAAWAQYTYPSPMPSGYLPVAPAVPVDARSAMMNQQALYTPRTIPSPAYAQPAWQYAPPPMPSQPAYGYAGIPSGYSGQPTPANYNPYPTSVPMPNGNNSGDTVPTTSSFSGAPSLSGSRAVQLSSSDTAALLPLSLPGYQLRVMEATKRVNFEVNGQRVTAEVPLFIYLPTGAHSPTAASPIASAPTAPATAQASKELRKVYTDLITMYDQDKIDKERIRTMLKRMDGIIDQLDANKPATITPSSPPAPTTAEPNPLGLPTMGDI